jgi:CRP-like cAMP-binding protein
MLPKVLGEAKIPPTKTAPNANSPTSTGEERVILVEMADLHEESRPKHPALAQLAQAFPDLVSRIRYQDGDIVVQEGEPDDSIYFLEEGALVVEQEVSEGTRHVLKVLSNKSESDQIVPFGEMSHMLDGKRSATIRSSGTSTVIKLEGRAFEPVFREFPDVARLLNLKLVERLRDANAHVKELTKALDPPVLREMVHQNRILLREGDVADELWQCPAGTLHEVRTGGGRTEVEPDADGFIDALPFFREGRWTRTIEVSSGSFLLKWSCDRPADVFRFHPELAVRLLRMGT